MNVTLTKDFTFEAAHMLPEVAADHKCRRLHGHSFRVEISLEGPVDPAKGWLVDYADLKAAFEPIWKQLDHQYLNEVEGLNNPTSENIARWIWVRLQPTLPWLHEVVIHETCTSRCRYRGD